MNSILRKMRLAGCAVVAVLWIVSPATAAEPDASARQSVRMANSTKTMAAPVRRHRGWSRYRLASWYASHVNYGDAVTSGRPCNWFCGRPFVLMVGVAF